MDEEDTTWRQQQELEERYGWGRMLWDKLLESDPDYAKWLEEMEEENG